MAVLPSLLIRLVLIVTTLCIRGSAQSEFCHPYAIDNPDSSLGFCVQVATYFNHSSNGYGTYVTVVVPRPGASATGWTAVGFGSKMDGALMLTVYGDPQSGRPPVFSARTTSGHSQPELITSTKSTSLPEIQLVSSMWQRASHSSQYSSSTYLASISFVCRECYNWPGAEIDVMSSNQPFIWAWNEDQVFHSFLEDESLDPHSHNVLDGATGSFSIDMRPHGWSSDNSTQEDMTNVAKIEGQHNVKAVRLRLWTLHGIVLGLAFLGLYPAGTVMIHMRSGNAFRKHWVVQLLATVIMTAGVVTGFCLHPKLDGTHQSIGAVVLILAWTQALLGWKHHFDFVKNQCRGWVSTAHVLLGRTLILMGCVNMLLGMSIRGRSQTFIESMFVFMVLEMVSVGCWIVPARDLVLSCRTYDTVEGPKEEQERFIVGEDDENWHEVNALDETKSEPSNSEKF